MCVSTWCPCTCTGTRCIGYRPRTCRRISRSFPSAIEHVTGWLVRVARNRITDLWRKKKPQRFTDAAIEDEEGEELRLEDLLPSPDAGPDALYARGVLLDELETAIDELPDDQREVFVAHELEGRSFKEMAAATGVSVNTLLSRKRYAVRHLRERLQSIYDDLTHT